MPDGTPLEPRYVVWPCDHCRNGIEFDVVQLAGRYVCRVPCPHCGRETELQEPSRPPRLVPDAGWVLPAGSDTPIVREARHLTETQPIRIAAAQSPSTSTAKTFYPGPAPDSSGASFGELRKVVLLPAQPNPPAIIPIGETTLPPKPRVESKPIVPVASTPPPPPALFSTVSDERFLPPPAAVEKTITVELPPDPPRPPPSAGGPVDARWLTDLGVVYFRQHQFGEAFHCFTHGAQRGFAAAQFCLAVCYLNGHGTAQDDAAALPWLQKAASQGDANAEFTLGMAYFMGRGVARDEALAAHWLQSAARRGHAEALRQIREMNPLPSGENENFSPPATASIPRVEPVPQAETVEPKHELQRLILGLFGKK
jgi:hypothetical protein